MEHVEGVCDNFHDFKERGMKFFDRSEARMEAEDKAKEEAKKKLWTRSQKIAALSIIAVIAMPPLSWFVVQGKEIIEKVIQVTDWYERHHEELQKKSLYTEPDSEQKPQLRSHY